MALIFINLRSADGMTLEATASRYQDKVLLPKGQWLVTLAGGSVAVVKQEEMPEHWQQQMGSWGRFSGE